MKDEYEKSMKIGGSAIEGEESGKRGRVRRQKKVPRAFGALSSVSSVDRDENSGLPS